MIYDIFIIGGGINGCGIARDASGRGLKICLAERMILPVEPHQRQQNLFMVV